MKRGIIVILLFILFLPFISAEKNNFYCERTLVYYKIVYPEVLPQLPKPL